MPWQAREPGRKAISLIRLVRPLCAGVSVNGPLIGLQTLLHFNRKRVRRSREGREAGRQGSLWGAFVAQLPPPSPTRPVLFCFSFESCAARG